MKTAALCPTCNAPFSFWRVVFAYSPFSLFCKSCRSRIVIARDREIMWSMLVVLGIITVLLAQFIIPRNLSRLAVLGVLWLVCFELLEIIVSLIIINTAQFSKPDESVGDNS